MPIRLFIVIRQFGVVNISATSERIYLPGDPIAPYSELRLLKETTVLKASNHKIRRCHKGIGGPPSFQRRYWPPS